MSISASNVVLLWWVTLTLSAGRLSTGLVMALLDGVYLVVWPRLAALATPLALLLGLAFGAYHPLFGEAFTTSFPLLMLMVVLGTLSGHLGLVFLIGYACGDFFFYHPGWVGYGRFGVGSGFKAWGVMENVARVRLPLLVEYVLMFWPLSFYAVTVKFLIRQLAILPRLGRPLSLVMSAILHASLTGSLVYLWCQAVPLLIRPVYTWRDVSIPAEAISNLQESYWLLVAAATVASFARMWVQSRTAYELAWREPVDVIQAKLQAAAPVAPLVDRVPALLGAGFRAALAVLLLAGLYQSWLDALLIAGVVGLITAIRYGLLPLPIGGWARIVARVPLVFRLAVGLAILYYVALAMDDQVRTAETFRPLVVMSAVAMALFFLLNPGVSPAHGATAGRKSAS